MSYDFAAIEAKINASWEANNPWAAPRVPSRPKKYVLEMFPYPSGDMHMGHVENYTIGDAIARYWRMRGYDVLHPMGFDSFGLPAENAAIQRGVHPREWTYANIEKMVSSFRKLGFAFDWDRMIRTSDPEYFRWNQWIFIKMFEAGLAYRKLAQVNWCPSCQTVLANEQISSGVCWRCSSVPELKDLEQWFFKTSEFADALLDDMEQLNWPENILQMQRNWIGRSHGARVSFRIEGLDEQVEIFTTRPDTIFGATFFVFAAEHPIARQLADRSQQSDAYTEFVKRVRAKTEIDRSAVGATREVFDLKAFAINPLNGERIPCYASDYVLMGYGTGAIMAVPAHDQRDFEFAQQIGAEIRVVIAPPDNDLTGSEMTEAFTGDGVMVNSGEFNGTPSGDAVEVVTKHIAEGGLGKAETQYRIRDWLLSRQRYWGTPIPMVHCPECGVLPTPLDQLPVTLPDRVDFNGTGDVSPLASAEEWVNIKCPWCGAAARRDTDTMDTFVDSSWYYARYTDPHNTEAPFDSEPANAWLPVDQYTGGAEHAVMHLIYARFFHKVFKTMGMVSSDEPFTNLLNNGKLLMGGKMMSKSLGNVVEPAEILDRFGADAARVFILFIGPPDADYDWPSTGADEVTGAWRFCDRVYRLVDLNLDSLRSAPEASGSSELRKTVHRLQAQITSDFDRFSFNTAIARMMEMQTALATEVRGDSPDFGVVREGVSFLLRSLSPIACFITTHLWEAAGFEGDVWDAEWPEALSELCTTETVTMIVQVDSKVRDRLEVPADLTEEAAVEQALASERVRELLDGSEPARVIARPPKLVNILTR